MEADSRIFCSMNASESIRFRYLLAATCLALLAGLAQFAMGRVWWCECGEASLWSGEIASMHNSQHFFDPYTFTHVLHGIGFYALLWLAFSRWADHGLRFVIAIGLEAVWEVIENTSIVIERYRESTISLGYYGDSILNSLADIAACASGYLLAFWLPVWISFVIFFGVEAALLWWIRDSLLLNILMLIRPLESVKEWQMGVQGLGIRDSGFEGLSHKVAEFDPGPAHSPVGSLSRIAGFLTIL